MNTDSAAGEGPAAPSADVGRLALQADSLLFSPARSTAELVQAYQLVYKNYLKSEYVDPHPSEMRYGAFNALPSTATFVAKLNDEIVTTASVVFDSPLGLPLEAIYHDEVEGLRAEHLRLCEVTMLADRRRLGFRALPSILNLFRLILRYALTFEKTTDVVISVNPSHDAFYTKYLPFSDLGPLRYYPAVKNAPAVAKRVNLRTIADHKNHKLYGFFMESALPEEVFSHRKRFTEEELREFFVVKRPIFRELPPSKLDFIRSLYPEYKFERILAPA